MSSPEIEMSLEHQIPVLIKKRQMSGDRAGSQCGLTSLLPMSCRGRAAAFARDLHSRLRNLGAAAADDCETTWIARDSQLHPVTRPTTSTNQRDLDTFYDFELECESPSSPVDEIEHPFPGHSPTEHKEVPFHDATESDAQQDPAKILHQQSDKTKNGFTFTTAFYSDSLPVKTQPSPRENGQSDRRLYSAMTFEGVARQNSFDEIDCVLRSSPVTDSERLRLPPYLSSTLDSDSEFESAKSDPSDCAEEVYQNGTRLENEVLENLSLADSELLDEEIVEIAEVAKEPIEQQEAQDTETMPSLEIIENISAPTSEIIEENSAPSSEIIEETSAPALEIIEEPSAPTLEIVTSEVPTEVKEVSPVPEVEPNLLSVEIEEEQIETEDDKPQRVRRCSSLKTGKTPPGTPGRKKIVRFADVLGLDLADVKTFMDEIPVIPKSAYDDLTGCDVASSPPVRAAPRLGALTLVPLFQLPRDLNERLERMLVCLESARVCDGVHVTVCGSVRVRNLDFHKTVHVRYSMNRWRTYTDLQANYAAGSCDGFSDRFQFVLYAPAITSGQRLELAVRFQCKGQQFWDNNAGTNYCFDCLALGAMPAAPASAAGPLHPTLDWHPSFY